MTLIAAANISKSFGDLDILNDISLSVPPKARIGFVGENGSGKSTLLKILMGIELPDTGTVSKAKNLTIGYLPQQIEVASDLTPYESCLQSFEGLIAMQEKLTRMEEQLHTGDAELLESYGIPQQQFENEGGYVYRSRIDQVLQGLGLTDGEEHRPWTQLSGGQKIRAYLAKLILSEPDLLVLDEPTNHLDIRSIEWLESYLKDFQGGVLMVSHDRYFLDQCVRTIWELSDNFEIYKGNYSAYLNQREERYKRQLAEYERQQQVIAKEEEYIRRNIAGQNTRQAQGRRKRLETLLRDSRITKPGADRAMKLKMVTDLRSGDLVLRTEGMKVGYQDDKKVLFSVPDLTLERGECAAIIGPNGTGKSTFLKTILGLLDPLSGASRLGSNLKIAYFAQAHEDLDPEKDLMDEISTVAPAMLPGEIRDYLAKYLFTGDDVYKKVKVLSGGERGRLALALLSLQGANLLLLDEPMNHLDIASQELLQSVLKEFQGTIILVSHDRFLIDGIATQIWDVRPKEHTLSVYKGTYSQYKDELRRKEEAERAAAEAIRKSVPVNPQTGKPAVKKRKLLKEKEGIEATIAEVEKEITELSNQLNQPSLSYQKISEISSMYNKKQSELEGLYDRWADLETQLAEE